MTVELTVGAVQSGAAATLICSVVEPLNAAAVRPTADPAKPTATSSASGRLGSRAIWLSVLGRPPDADDLPDAPEESRDHQEHELAAGRAREHHQEPGVRDPVFDAPDTAVGRRAPALDTAVGVAAR